MSIEIDREKCVGCGSCVGICPGGLIRLDDEKACIPQPERCWGCASCVKECSEEAIALFLGEDMGGLGGRMTARQEDTLLFWTLTRPDGTAQTLTVDRRDSNKY
ncbi:MAG: ferredoxin family protein [Zoogloeaceae bacterium]|jgi:adenylylsulfate reductase subunit B|nr:ferredoxin family protein [Zoogloeaceae bacterium]